MRTKRWRQMNQTRPAAMILQNQTPLWQLSRTETKKLWKRLLRPLHTSTSPSRLPVIPRRKSHPLLHPLQLSRRQKHLYLLMVNSPPSRGSASLRTPPWSLPTWQPPLKVEPLFLPVPARATFLGIRPPGAMDRPTNHASCCGCAEVTFRSISFNSLLWSYYIIRRQFSLFECRHFYVFQIYIFIVNSDVSLVVCMEMWAGCGNDTSIPSNVWYLYVFCLMLLPATGLIVLTYS